MVLNPNLFLESGVADMAASFGTRILGRNVNRSMMNGIKKVDNMVGKIGGSKPNTPPSAQPMPQPVPTQPNQQPR